MDVESINLKSKSFLIIDEDDVIHNMVKFQLKSMGVDKVDLFDDANDGWVAVINKTYDFIFFDWKLQKIPGAALFSRLRGLGRYNLTPILVTSNVIYKKDFRVFDEYPGTALIEKPFSNRQFEKKVKELFVEVIWYEQNKRTIVELLEQVKRDGKAAVKILQKLVDKAPNPGPLQILGGKGLIDYGYIDEAEQWFRDILKRDEENHLAWNELGKIFKIKELLDEAAKSFKSAHKLSPQNISRICTIAELELERKDPKAAKAMFEEALEIDKDDETAKAGVTVSTNLEQHFRATKENKEDIHKSSLASLLNLTGVNLVKSGRVNDGLEQYNCAMKFVNNDEDKARLIYNMGLAHIKNSNKEEALKYFEKASAFKVAGFTKPQAYIKKIKLGR